MSSPRFAAVVVVGFALLAAAHAAWLAPTTALPAASAIAAARGPGHHRLTTPPPSAPPTPSHRAFGVGCRLRRPTTAASNVHSESEPTASDQLLAVVKLAHALAVPDLLQYAVPAGASGAAPNALRLTAADMQKRLVEIQDAIGEVGQRLAGSDDGDEAVAKGAQLVAAAIATAVDVLDAGRGLTKVVEAEAGPICAFQKRLAEALANEYDFMTVLKDLVQNPLRCKLAVAVDALRLYAARSW